MPQFTPAVPLYGVLGPSVVGMYLAYAGTKTITATAGQCSDSTGTNTITVPATSTTISLLASGLNGLDTGTVAASTMYAVFAIGDPSGRNPAGFLLSTSATAPVMPAGATYGTSYGEFRRIGWIKTDGSSNILAFYQEPVNDVIRLMQYDAPIAVLTAGVATSYTAVSLAAAVPTTAGRVVIASALTPNAASDTASIRPTGATGDYIVQVGQVAAVVTRLQYELLPLIASGAMKIDYKVSTASAALTVAVQAYEDLL